MLYFVSNTHIFPLIVWTSVVILYCFGCTSFVVAPVKIASSIKSQISDFKNLKSENIILKEEIMRLKKWQTLAIQNSKENRVFKKLLNSTDNSLSLVKTASLISRNDFMYGKMININAGLKDGILNQMAVINHRGLLGRTIETSIETSKVMLLTDPNSSIAVKTIFNENFSLLQGADDGIHLVSIFKKGEQIPKIGDLVVTSGTAQIFPSDILVGKIVKASKDRYFVLPFVDFKNIEYVQVVESK